MQTLFGFLLLLEQRMFCIFGPLFGSRFDVFYQSDHRLDGLGFQLFPCGRNIVFQDWEKDQGRDTRGKTAVVKDEAAVEITGGCTHGGTHQTCGDTCAHTVTSDDRAKAGCKGNTVDIALGGDRPSDVTSVDQAEERRYDIKEHVTCQNRPYVFRMLAHGSKGQCSENYADGRAGKACTRSEDRNHIDVDQKDNSINTDIDQAERHSVFFRKITGETGVFQETAVAAKCFSVETVSDDDAEKESYKEERGRIQMVAVTKAFINIIGIGQNLRRGNTHGLVHKVKYEETKNTEGKAAVIKVVAFVPCFCTGKNRRDHKAQG